MTKFSYQVQLLRSFLKQTPKLMLGGIRMRFYKAIVAPLILITAELFSNFHCIEAHLLKFSRTDFDH